jgi:aryl-alcohol dehydrogenase-like predicted oxidoreductase
MEALLTSQHAGLHSFVSVQPHWSLVQRENFEKHARPVVKKFGLGIIPYSPLGRGFLTGKYRRHQPLPESKRHGSVKDLLTDKNFNLLDTLEELGRARGKTPGQMALGWLLSQEGMAAPIIGANTPAQLADSLGAVGLQLSADELRVLDEMTAFPKDDDD